MVKRIRINEDNNLAKPHPKGTKIFLVQPCIHERFGTILFYFLSKTSIIIVIHKF
jgi:hypothetical protein